MNPSTQQQQENYQESAKKLGVQLKDSELMKNLNFLCNLFSNATKTKILMALYFNDCLTKTEIHHLLTVVLQVKLSYKNTLWYLDNLKKSGLIKFKKDIKNHNATIVSLDKKTYLDAFCLANKYIEEVFNTMNYDMKNSEPYIKH